MKKVAISALVPPELIYSCEKTAIDINNLIPSSNTVPKEKLCAWCAIWRDMILTHTIDIDALIVVAGGDCHNTLVEGQRVAQSKIKTHYFFYPFCEDPQYLESQLLDLENFLGGIKDQEYFKKIRDIKKIGLSIEKKRIDSKVDPKTAFDHLISFSDLRGNVELFKDQLNQIEERKIESDFKIALIGVPPIFPDFHTTALSFGLQIIYDELPYEFVRLTGANITELAKSYVRYTFARDLETRIEEILTQIEQRKVEGVIHYTQYACHHTLEDSILRDQIDYPFITLQGYLPQRVPEQIKLRLEAFSELLRRR